MFSNLKTADPDWLNYFGMQIKGSNYWSYTIQILILSQQTQVERNHHSITIHLTNTFSTEGERYWINVKISQEGLHIK